MTMKQIGDRLRAEFPERSTAFRCAIHAHQSGNTSYDLNLYYWTDANECRSLACHSLEDGIAQIHAALHGPDLMQQVPTDMMSVAEVVA